MPLFPFSNSRLVGLFICITLVAQTFTSTALSTGVVSPADTWIMQEGGGNTFSDSSGTANTVTAGGTIMWEAGPGALTTGAHFPGSFDTTAANYTSFNPTASSAWSVSTWVSFDTIDNNSEMVLSQLGSSGQGWYLYRMPGNTVYKIFDAILTNGSGGKIDKSFSLIMENANFLYHVVLTVDGSGTAAGVNMWLNGSLTQCWPNSDTLTGSMTPNTPVSFGSLLSGFERHTGFLSSTRTYNRVLTTKEILTLYNAGPMADTYLAVTSVLNPVQASNFATLDADCSSGAKNGGGTATDNTQRINAVLLTASSANPVDLVLSGCTVTTGIIIPPTGYTTIEGNGWTSGVFVLAGSNAPGITNGFGIYPVSANGLNSSAAPITPILLPMQGSSVTLRNLIVNGNRNGGNVVGSDPRGGNSMWIPGVSLCNLSGVTLDNVDIYNAPTYHLIADNVTNLLIENSHFESTALSGGNNTDGVHVDGPSTGITISGSYFKTGDDAIAMNGPEGYSGTISTVTLTSNNVDLASYNALREYGTVTGLTINNCSEPDVVGKTVGGSTLIGDSAFDAISCPGSSGGGGDGGSGGGGGGGGGGETSNGSLRSGSVVYSGSMVLK